MSSDTLSNILAARPLTKSGLTDNDIFYVVDQDASSGDKSKGIVASELLSFTGGDVTGSTNGELSIGSDKVTNAMLKADATSLTRITKVDTSGDAVLVSSEACSWIYCTTSNNAMNVEINSGVFGDGDFLFITQIGTNPVTITGTCTLAGPNGVDGTARTIATTGDKTSLKITIISGAFANVEFIESHEVFAIDNYSDSGHSALAATDDLLINAAGSGPAERITGRAVRNIDSLSTSASSITVGSSRVNKTIIVTTTGTSASTISITAGDYEAGDWFAVLLTGDTTGDITISNTGVEMYTSGETTNGSYTIDDQFAFVTVFCYEADKFVLLGPVSKV